MAESGSEPRGEGGGRRGVILEKVKKRCGEAKGDEEKRNRKEG